MMRRLQEALEAVTLKKALKRSASKRSGTATEAASHQAAIALHLKMKYIEKTKNLPSAKVAYFIHRVGVLGYF
jgi:hypothetical protein